MPLRRRRKGRGLEISLCDFSNIGEDQTREVARHAGLGEEHSRKENSSCKLFGLGGNGICLRKKQGQCFKMLGRDNHQGFCFSLRTELASQFLCLQVKDS